MLPSADEAPDRIRDEWFPVALVDDVLPGTWHPFDLLDDRYVLVCSADGAVMVTRDTCPHRGAQLTLGQFNGNRLVCPYHGWEFDGATGRCLHRPSHPEQSPPDAAALRTEHALAAYGMWWVCIGESPRDLPSFPTYEANPGLSIILGPKTVRSSGPRIVENFLDMAHFPYVHAGYLGQVPHTSVKDYEVTVNHDELLLTNCVFWQPNPGPASTQGGEVTYEYGVSHPYAARLTKIPSEADGGELSGFSILIVATPTSETECRVWNVTTVVDPNADLPGYNDFQAIIFGQDVPTVESQRPKRLPLDPAAELHVRADRASLAYRRWLRDRGIRYGTSDNEMVGR
jgi:phenylpropionate dioxygenase-like ring-hydroxylating dioxygenase large terminal subunit